MQATCNSGVTLVRAALTHSKFRFGLPALIVAATTVAAFVTDSSSSE